MTREKGEGNIKGTRGTKKPSGKKKAVSTTRTEKRSPPKKSSPAAGKRKSVTPKKGTTEFPIVGIGASAGGLEALEKFFSHMSHDPGIAFVIIQHLSPKHKSIMASLLSKFTRMKVLELEDGMGIEPNRVYLNPPHKDVITQKNKLYLMDFHKVGGISHPIDTFFRSLSEEQGEKAIGIILSGTATDGTLGVKAIKGEGGIAMVQDPESAKYDGMPRSAIATGLVDFILPVEKIPEKLLYYIRHPYIDGALKPEITDDQFSYYLKEVHQMVRDSTGHDFSEYKQNTIRRRIERRMAVHQIKKISDYVVYLRNSPVEVGALFKDLLIGVTNFFRDTDAFEILKEKAIPELLEKANPDLPVRIWVVGCSTGEEAYSVAIIFSEVMERLNKHFTLQIFASDIDAEAIDFARRGSYPESIAADVSPERLSNFFIHENNSYTVKQLIRDSTVFSIQNLIKDPPFSRLDMVSCRNLLIYMNASLQKKIIPAFNYIINRDGLLFMGPSESIGEHANLFTAIDSKWKIYKNKEAHIGHIIQPLPTHFLGAGLPRRQLEEVGKPSITGIHTMAEKIILDDFAPPGVLINEKFEIIHFMGITDPYLKPPTGRASFNVLEMAREGLRHKLGTALHSASRRKDTVVSGAVQIKQNDKLRTVDVVVRPIIDRSLPEGYLIVVFYDKTPLEKPVQRKRKQSAGAEVDPTIADLEHELSSTKEYLQATIEELEGTNEELKSMNEEMQSINEELQSTNEELETSKEEIQSTNEELLTVNAELQKKIEELSRANDDINNLLFATDIATLFLDTRLRINRFSPTITALFKLLPSDIGRSIGDITSIVPDDIIEKVSREVLNTLAWKKEEFISDDGIWYSMRVGPYRTMDNVIGGVVVTFIDVTASKEVDKVRRLATVLRDSNDAITVQDFKGNITAWNRGAEKMYGWRETQALKMNIRDIVPAEKHDELALIVEKLRKGKKVESFETRRITNEGKIVDVFLTVTTLVDDRGRPVEFSTTERQIDEMK